MRADSIWKDMTDTSSHAAWARPHVSLIQRLELNPRRGEIVKRSRTGTVLQGGGGGPKEGWRWRYNPDQGLLKKSPGHNVEPRAVKPAYNNLRSANPDGSIQLILRQNLSLVLNLAGLKAISLPPSPPPSFAPSGFVLPSSCEISPSLASRFRLLYSLSFTHTSTRHPAPSYFVEFTISLRSCVARAGCSFN